MDNDRNQKLGMVLLTGGCLVPFLITMAGILVADSYHFKLGGWAALPLLVGIVGATIVAVRWDRSPPALPARLAEGRVGLSGDHSDVMLHTLRPILMGLPFLALMLDLKLKGALGLGAGVSAVARSVGGDHAFVVFLVCAPLCFLLIFPSRLRFRPRTRDIELVTFSLLPAWIGSYDDVADVRDRKSFFWSEVTEVRLQSGRRFTVARQGPLGIDAAKLLRILDQGKTV